VQSYIILLRNCVCTTAILAVHRRSQPNVKHVVRPRLGNPIANSTRLVVFDLRPMSLHYLTREISSAVLPFLALFFLSTGTANINNTCRVAQFCLIERT